MPRISTQKIEKIKEQILFYLYTTSPKQVFTSKIAAELARDEEFIKKLLIELENQQLVNKISKNSKGKNYKVRLRWRISNKAYEAYQTHQINTNIS
jgi:predicted transcriptional regulator with HTH domain